jgi:hypothetical protein
MAEGVEEEQEKLSWAEGVVVVVEDRLSWAEGVVVAVEDRLSWAEVQVNQKRQKCYTEERGTELQTN